MGGIVMVSVSNLRQRRSGRPDACSERYARRSTKSCWRFVQGGTRLHVERRDLLGAEELVLVTSTRIVPPSHLCAQVRICRCHPPSVLGQVHRGGLITARQKPPVTRMIWKWHSSIACRRVLVCVFWHVVLFHVLALRSSGAASLSEVTFG